MTCIFKDISDFEIQWTQGSNLVGPFLGGFSLSQESRVCGLGLEGLRVERCTFDLTIL